MKDKRFIFTYEEDIPGRYMDDVHLLRNFIEEDMEIKSTDRDIFKFWSHVSEKYCAGWLSPDFYTNEYETRKEFLIEEMKEFGRIIYE